MTIEVDQLKLRHREMWGKGDYASVAQYIQQAAEGLVERIGISEGMEVLDIATGTGNAAIPAARAGARVTGLDLVPELLAVARRRAAEAGVDVEWVEGDAEALPFEDGRFDRVVSVFGHMFAPRHGRASEELLRVCRQGGSVGMCNWTAEGVGGQLFRTVGSYIPPIPDYALPPVLWGQESYVRDMLGAAVADVEIEHRAVTIEHDSPESWFEFMAGHFGPFITARTMLEPQGRWDNLRRDLIAIFDRANEAEDRLRFRQEYLLVVARRA